MYSKNAQNMQRAKWIIVNGISMLSRNLSWASSKSLLSLFPKSNHYLEF